MTTVQTALDLPTLVRERDYRRFLAIQFATPTLRPILYALTAFAGEMAEIPHHVREPLAGFMRFAWWREGLEAMEQGHAPRSHPLLQELAPWLRTHPAAYAPLYGLIHCGQQLIEDANATTDREALLDELWKMALNGADQTPLKTLRSLPLGHKIGPLKILHMMLRALIN